MTGPATPHVREIVNHFIKIGDSYEELRQTVPESAIAPALVSELASVMEGDPLTALGPLFAQLSSHYAASAGSVPGAKTSMERLIDRMLAEAPKLTDANGDVVPNQAPAIDCMVMVSTGLTCRGSLSKTPEGTYRMMSPGTEEGRPVMVEQFFSTASVVAFTLIRPITLTKASPLILPDGLRS
jgi:hypothetical protein